MLGRTDFALRIPSKTYDVGRVCEWPGCQQLLSTYNPGEHCSVHEKMLSDEQLIDMRDSELADCFTVDTKRCSTCGEKLPRSEHYFWRKETSKDGLNSQCKLCGRDSDRQRRERGKEVGKRTLVESRHKGKKTLSAWNLDA